MKSMCHCGGIISLYFSLSAVVLNLIAASKGGCEKKLNYGGGTHKVNGEFSGPDYTHTIYLIFSSFFIFFLRFSLPIFHHSRLQPLAKAFSFRDHWSGSNGVTQHYYHKSILLRLISWPHSDQFKKNYDHKQVLVKRAIKLKMVSKYIFT